MAEEPEKTKLEEFTKLFDERFPRLSKLWEMVKGKADIKNRIGLIANPEIPQTMSRLNASQVSYVNISIDIGKAFRELQPLEDDAKGFLLTNKSLDGKGIQEVIDFERVENYIISGAGLPQKISKDGKQERTNEEKE